ncbi:MAG: PAS domain S-box protein [bacterium]|nr:PAS domain S-box protein [bacterium]
MKDNSKTKDELIKEMNALRERIAYLEASPTEDKFIIENPQWMHEGLQGLFKNLVTSIPATIFQREFDKNYTMIFLSNRIENISGYPASDFINNSVRNFSSIIYPEDLAMFEKTIQEEINQSKSYIIEYRIIHKDGSIRWVSERGQSIYGNYRETVLIDGIIFDITKQKSAQQKTDDHNQESQAIYEELWATMNELNKRLISAHAETIESKERYKKLSEVATEGIVFHDKGKIVDTNSACEKMFGYEKDEMIGMDILNTVPEDFKPALYQYIADNIEQYENTALKKNGTTFPVEVFAREVVFKEKTYRVATVRDLTNIKKVEEALQRSKQELNSIIRNTPDIIYRIDTEGKITFINDAVKKYGYSPKEMLGRHILEFVYPEDKELVKYRINERRTGDRETNNLEIRLLTKDNSKVYFESIAQPINPDKVSLLDARGLYDSEKPSANTFIGTQGIIRDITERKLGEDALQESEERFHYLADASIEAIIINKGGICLEANQVAAEMFGYKDPFDMIGIFITDIIAPEYHGIVEKHILEHSEESYEAIALQKDGKTFHVEIRAKSMPYKGDTVRVTSIRDIREQKKVEIEKERIEVQLHQSQKMKAIGTLAGGIAHDFNNILSGILGYTELAMKKIQEDHPISNYLKQVLQAANRASDLVKQILTLSRQQEQEMKPTNINPIAKESIKLIRASIPTTIDIRTNLAAESDLVLANATQIHQIIMNLCTNAAHAMQKTGGILNINLDNIDLNSNFVNNYPDLYEGPYLKLEISDTGHGISHDIIDRIFDPFFTTKQQGEGTGLGLSVIHGIIKSYKGAITVHSEIDRGTTFKVFLPLAEGIRQGKGTEEFLPLPGGNERILIVDDEAAIVDYEKEMLKDLGYEVVSRTSSLEALEAFKFQPDNFDLVITDQTMPNMTGANMAKEMIKIRPDIPIILCTGFSKQIGPDNAGEFGLREFLFKPVTSRNMAEAVRRALEKKEAPGHEDIISGDLSKVLPFCGMKILVAEDIAANRKLMSIMLKNIGCESETVTNGKEALERIRDKAFDAVLMDINMPVMGGIEATKIIRNEIKSKIPVIALTGADIDREKDKLLSAGIDDFLLKPISTDNLQNILQKWMR